MEDGGGGNRRRKEVGEEEGRSRRKEEGEREYPVFFVGLRLKSGFSEISTHGYKIEGVLEIRLNVFWHFIRRWKGRWNGRWKGRWNGSPEGFASGGVERRDSEEVFEKFQVPGESGGEEEEKERVGENYNVVEIKSSGWNLRLYVQRERHKKFILLPTRDKKKRKKVLLFYTASASF
jgi:hypothetical protein